MAFARVLHCQAMSATLHHQVTHTVLISPSITMAIFKTLLQNTHHGNASNVASAQEPPPNSPTTLFLPTALFLLTAHCLLKDR